MTVPTVWSSQTRQVSPLTGDDLLQWEADRKASVDARREERLQEFKEEAGKRIAALYAEEPFSFDLVFAEINENARAAELAIKVAEGGTLTRAEQDEQTAFLNRKTQVDAIRTAEGEGSAALDAAGADDKKDPDVRRSEIEAVTVGWPV